MTARSDRANGRGGLVLIAIAAVAAAVLWAAGPAAAEETCPETVDLCGTTNVSGEYVLSIPSFSFVKIIPGYEWMAEFEDCVWEVEVDFGDGTPPEQYVFEASVGLSGAHTFPTPGLTYMVVATGANGVHQGSGEPCPDFQRTAAITYPIASSEPPSEEPPVSEPTEPPPAGPLPLPVTALEAPSADPQTAGAGPFQWARCGAGVRSYAVACGRARRIAKRASKALRRALDRSAPRSVPISGFGCRLRGGKRPRIACRRGFERVTAPLR